MADNVIPFKTKLGLNITGRAVRIESMNPHDCICVETQVFIDEDFSACLKWMRQSNTGQAYLMPNAPTRKVFDYIDTSPAFILAINPGTGELLGKKELEVINILTKDMAPNAHKAIAITQANGTVWLAWKIPDLRNVR